MMFDVDHRIAGNAAATEGGRFADIFDPNTGMVQKRVTLATQADLDRAVTAARGALYFRRPKLSGQSIVALVDGHPSLKATRP